MDYHLYHDESKVSGYWHGILLVPDNSKAELIRVLNLVRQNTNHLEPIGIKHVKAKHPRVCTAAEAWLLIAAAAMRTSTAGKSFPIHFGERLRGRPVYSTYDRCLGLKFILFRSMDNHCGMDMLKEHASKIETTFRVGLKGGMHYLGSTEEPIRICTMHFDGHEHYGRRIDRSRIIDRIAGLRSYCSLDVPPCGIHDHTSDHRKLDAIEHEDCQLLQLTDLLIGGFRTLLGHGTQPCHKRLAQPISFPLDAYLRGFAGYRNSRWFSSFWMSQCTVGIDGWSFSTLEKYTASSNDQTEIVF